MCAMLMYCLDYALCGFTHGHKRALHKRNSLVNSEYMTWQNLYQMRLAQTFEIKTHAITYFNVVAGVLISLLSNMCNDSYSALKQRFFVLRTLWPFFRNVSHSRVCL